MVRNTPIVLLALAVASCGTTSSVKLSIAPPERINFQFSDERPIGERISRTQDSEAGTTSYYGDESISPSPPDLFKSYMAKNLSELLSNKNVKLTSFLVSASDPRLAIDPDRYFDAVNSVPNANPLGAILALPLILGIESIKSQKIVSVHIRGALNDQEFSTVCSDSFRGRATENNVQTVILACLDKVADGIREGDVK